MDYSVVENDENAVLLENVVGDACPASPVTSTLNAVPTRTMNWWKLAALAYVTVCGGPFGMEPAVQAAGALPVLIMVGVLAIFWAMPQALMTAEMSTMFPVNGGYIVVRSLSVSHESHCSWVSSWLLFVAVGDTRPWTVRLNVERCWFSMTVGCASLRYWACITSFNSVLSNVMDVPVSPLCSGPRVNCFPLIPNVLSSQLYPVMLAGYVSQEFPSVSSAWLTALKFLALVIVAALNIKGALV
jgi:hypothetical protein